MVTTATTDRKQEILAATAELLQTRSFSSFSYADLSKQLGISKASIHILHHFATKEELGRSLVERYGDSRRRFLAELDRQFEDPWERLEAFLNGGCNLADAGSKICPMGCLRVEHNVNGERIRDELHEFYQLGHWWLARLLEEGRTMGVMAFPGTSDGQAMLIHSALQGALQNARAEGAGQFHVVLNQLKAWMKPEESRHAMH
ncbi:MAG: TetR/AcrR family transcriptional regulator [Candidatus Latescibacteria bacterium]|nr:TetR/AcrR family transcriptional regulator [Candidatus Latescibacterota bacterium]